MKNIEIFQKVTSFIVVITSIAMSEPVQRYTLKSPSPVPGIYRSKLHVTAGVAGTVSSRSVLDTIQPRSLQWETGALINLELFSLYGSVAFQHGIGSAVYEILTDSTKTGTLKNYSYGSPNFSIEALKNVVDTRSFIGTLGIGGTVGLEVGQQFLNQAKNSTGTVSTGATNPFSGSFYASAMETFPQGTFSWGMYQRIHWKWIETQTQTPSPENGFKLIEQGFSATFNKVHRIYAGLGINLTKEPLAALSYPISVALGYSWIGKLK